MDYQTIYRLYLFAPHQVSARLKEARVLGSLREKNALWAARKACNKKIPRFPRSAMQNYLDFHASPLHSCTTAVLRRPGQLYKVVDTPES